MIALASYQVAGLIGAAVFACLYWFGIGMLLLIERRRQRRGREWHRQAGREYARYVADFSIRRTKRQALQEMLAAERQYRDMGAGDDVIDGTCSEVEVRR